MFIFVSYYMQQILHYSASKAGVGFLPFALGVIVAATAATNLLPKVGPRTAVTAGLLTTALGLLWLTQIGVHTSYWTHLFPQQIVMSLGLGLAFPALSSTALTKVRDRDSSVASAMVNTSTQVDASLGAALLNTVAATATANYIASHGPRLEPYAVVHGFTEAFLVGAIIVAAGALVSAVLVNAKASDLSNPAAPSSSGRPQGRPPLHKRGHRVRPWWWSKRSRPRRRLHGQGVRAGPTRSFP